MDSSRCPRLLALLQALLLAHVPAAAPSPPAETSTITSRAGETVRLHCRPDPAGQPIRRVSWTLLRDGLRATVHGYWNGTDRPGDRDAGFGRRTGLSVRPGEAVLTIRDVGPRDSGTYRCDLGDGRAAVPRDVFLRVVEDQHSVVIYGMLGFIVTGLVAWLASCGALCKTSELDCGGPVDPRPDARDRGEEPRVSSARPGAGAPAAPPPPAPQPA